MVYIAGVVVFGRPIAAILVHFAARGWRSARLDLRRRLGKGSAISVPSPYARIIWSLSVAALCADWIYFTAANAVRQTNSKTTDLRFPAGSLLILVVGLSAWAVSLLAMAVMWKMCPRQEAPPMLKRAE